MRKFVFGIVALAAVALFAAEASAAGRPLVVSRSFSRVGSFGYGNRVIVGGGYGYNRPIVSSGFYGSSYGYGASYCPPVVTFAQPYCPPPVTFIQAPPVCYPQPPVVIQSGYSGYGVGGYGTVGGYGQPVGGFFRGY